MSEVMTDPTRVELTTIEGAEFKVYIGATPETEAELEKLVEALGGWDRVQLGEGVLEKRLMARGNPPGVAGVSIDLGRLIGPPPEPAIRRTIRRKIDLALGAGDES